MNRKIFYLALTLCMIGLLAGSFMIVKGATIFTDGFESGSLTPTWTRYLSGTSATMAIDSTIVNSGSHSIKVNSVGGTDANIYVHTLPSPTTPNPIYLREYVYVTPEMLTVPSTNGDYYEVGGFADQLGYNYGNGEICVFNFHGTLCWGLYVRNTGGTPPYDRWISTANTTAAAPLTPGWHSLELRHLWGAAGPSPNGHETLTVDGQVVVDVAVRNSDRDHTYVVIGGSQDVATPSSTWTYYIDDVSVSDSPFEFQLTTSTNAGTVTPRQRYVLRGRDHFNCNTPRNGEWRTIHFHWLDRHRYRKLHRHKQSKNYYSNQ